MPSKAKKAPQQSKAELKKLAESALTEFKKNGGQATVMPKMPVRATIIENLGRLVNGSKNAPIGLVYKVRVHADKFPDSVVMLFSRYTQDSALAAGETIQLSFAAYAPNAPTARFAKTESGESVSYICETTVEIIKPEKKRKLVVK